MKVVVRFGSQRWPLSFLLDELPHAIGDYRGRCSGIGVLLPNGTLCSPGDDCVCVTQLLVLEIVLAIFFAAFPCLFVIGFGKLRWRNDPFILDSAMFL